MGALYRMRSYRHRAVLDVFRTCLGPPRSALLVVAAGAPGGRTVSVTVEVPWPCYPVTTPGGKPSTAKRAGKPIPWLSANVVNNLPRPVHMQLRALWREATKDAACGCEHGVPLTFPVSVAVCLVKRTAQSMDAFAVLEGAKPLVDGLVSAGVLPDDDELHVSGAYGVARKSANRWLGVQVTLTPR